MSKLLERIRKMADAHRAAGGQENAEIVLSKGTWVFMRAALGTSTAPVVIDVETIWGLPYRIDPTAPPGTVFILPMEEADG